MLTYLLAVLAACANATSSVMQRKANRKVPRKQNLSPKLIWSLFHEPAWFIGIAAVFAGFLLQATALGNGGLAVVEPILVLELPATLILASVVFGSRMRSREWGSAVAMTVALAGLLYFLSPSGGQSFKVRWYGWFIGIGVNLAVIAALVAQARRGQVRSAQRMSSGAAQAAVLGVAAGATFGLTAALMKAMTETFRYGLATLFTSWELYAMIAAGGLGMFLLQSAMNAGRLLAAQPGITLSDPIVSILWGVLIFHERVRGGWYIILAVLSGLLLTAAVVILARSPLLSGTSGQREEGDRGHERGAVSGREREEASSREPGR